MSECTETHADAAEPDPILICTESVVWVEKIGSTNQFFEHIDRSGILDKLGKEIQAQVVDW